MLRECYACGSNETYISKRGNVQWYSNGSIGWLCKRCNTRYITNPRWHPITHKLWITFRDKQIYIKKNPRIGVCNWCRAVIDIDCKRTDMHHETYDEKYPLNHAIEICSNCHGKYHRKLQLEALTKA